jgi:hypothetical protein
VRQIVDIDSQCKWKEGRLAKSITPRIRDLLSTQRVQLPKLSDKISLKAPFRVFVGQVSLKIYFQADASHSDLTCERYVQYFAYL